MPVAPPDRQADHGSVSSCLANLRIASRRLWAPAAAQHPACVAGMKGLIARKEEVITEVSSRHAGLIAPLIALSTTKSPPLGWHAPSPRGSVAPASRRSC